MSIGESARITGANLHTGARVRHVDVDEWLSAIEDLGASAVIFDCDGTLVHSSDAHLGAMQDAAAAQGFAMAQEWYQQRTGLDRETLFREFQACAGLSFDVARAISDSIVAFSSYASLIEPVPETLTLVTSLVARSVPIAVGTNAERSIACLSLAAIGLSGILPTIVSISDDLPPKPDPAIFREAARRLGVPPGQCLVIEDSDQGLAAARSAGMSVLMLKTSD